MEVNDESVYFTADKKTETLARIITDRARLPITRVLVVGCGTGREAAVLSLRLKADVVGIDLGDEFPFDPRAAKIVTLLRADATALEFADDSFDLVFSFHVLEHIPEYRKALQEMKRVLKPGGIYLIGVPNKSALLQYLGSGDITDWRTKIVSNLRNWKMRALGRWENRYGAHAGFSRAELQDELRGSFGNMMDVTHRYYHNLYSNHQVFLKTIANFKLDRFVLPALYFVGEKTKAADVGRE